LLKILKGQNATTLQEFSYNGPTSLPTLKQISRFLSLRHLSLNTHFIQNRFTKSHVQFLEKLPRLKSVDLNLRNFSVDAIEAVGRWLAGLEELSDLTLNANGPRNHAYVRRVFNKRTYHHVSILTLHFNQHPSSSDFSSLIPSTFPSLQKFSIISGLQELDGSQEFGIEDIIMGLKTLPMTDIQLYNLQLRISFDDIITILTTWPLLQVLHLIPAATFFFRFSFSKLPIIPSIIMDQLALQSAFRAVLAPQPLPSSRNRPYFYSSVDLSLAVVVALICFPQYSWKMAEKGQGRTESSQPFPKNHRCPSIGW
jgi:hypothetical protein